MKKILSLVLCILMTASVLAVFTGCGSKSESKGAIIPIYVSKMPTNFDPAFCLNDTAGIAMVNLLFEGLFKYDSNGKVVNALATGYKFYTEEGEKKLDIYINKNANWSDGTAVTANDFIFAWTRLLDPWNTFEAASLLYQIKNAKDYKNGTGTDNSSPSDLGFLANGAGNKTLTIIFENDEIDEELFLEHLASPALVPLPERKAKALMTTYKHSYDWTTHVVTMESNGPFKVKSYDLGRKLVLERNAYYLRNVEKDKLAEKVTPYRLEIIFRDVNSEEATKLSSLFNYDLFKDGEILFDSYLPLELRQTLSGVKTLDTLTTFSLMFNTLPLSEITGNDELDSTPGIVTNKKVRQALSLVLDRQKIAEKVVYATPATGLIPSGVFNTTRNTSFRKVGGDIIASTANIEQAKKLLKESGISGGDITIAVQATDEVAVELMKDIKKVWEELTWDGKREGIKVKILELGTLTYTNKIKEYEGLTLDVFLEAYRLGASPKYSVDKETRALTVTGYEKIDVFAVDLQSLSTDAFSTLAPFSREFSGGGRPPIEEVSDKDFPPVRHRSGYLNEQFEQLIKKAFDSVDRAKRAEFLHEAEEMLLDDAVVAPIFVYKNAYVISKELEKISFDYFGMANFKKALYKNYVEEDEVEETKAKPKETTAAAE